MAALLRSHPLSSLFCIVALGIAFWSCGSSVDVEPSPPPTGGSGGSGSGGGSDGGNGGAGGEMTPPDPPDAGADAATGGGPGCDQGTTPIPPANPGEQACNCPSSPGITLSGDCGALTLTAPYVEANDPMYCSPSMAYAYGFYCAWNFTWVVLNACVAKDTAPCIRIRWNKPDNADEPVTIEGKLIDGAGEVFTLSDIALDGTLPWNGPAATGTFKAAGTGEKGNKKITIEGTFDLCVAESSACPN
jgi:hypothetical protein